MELPEIIKDRMDLEINDQLSITLFPDDANQPKCDVIKLNFTEIEEKKTSIYMTSCEAMEIASALSSAVQFYLYNQEQYREEVLDPRMKMSNDRELNDIEDDDGYGYPECFTGIIEEVPQDTVAIIEEDHDEEDHDETDF